VDELVQALSGPDETARARARQLLPREDAATVAARVAPLIGHDQAVVWTAAFQVLSDVANETAVPGREADRAKVAAVVTTLLLAPDQPAAIKKRGLRLVPIAVPPDLDLGPVAALLDDPELHEKARVALLEAGTPPARAVLRARLTRDNPDAVVGYLNALGQLRDRESLPAIAALTRSDNPDVRIAAARALAWTGDPGHLKAVQEVAAASGPASKPEAIDAELRLLATIARNPDHRAVAIAAHLDLLRTEQGAARDAALAGLGRVGDASCVGPVLAVVGASGPPTSRIGLAALSAMPGDGVTEAIVNAHASQKPAMQTALLSVLGTRKALAALPILTAAARSDDPAVRQTAYQSLAEAGLAGGVDPLIAAVSNESGEVQQAARASLLTLAGTLSAAGEREPAGRAYLAVLAATKDDEIALIREALDGLATNPTAAAFELVPLRAAVPELRETALRAMMSTAGALTAAGRKDRAIALYEMVRDANPPTAMVPALIEGMTAAGAKVDLQGLTGVISLWHVVGPFELGENQEGWETAFVDEPNVDLVGRYMSGKGRVQWKPVQTDDPQGKIDLRKTIANRDNCVGYAYATVQVDTAVEAMLLLGVDDSEKVWVNGQKVFEQFVARPLQVDQDRVPITLKQGPNTVLLKVHQNSQGWEFCARLVTPDGRPVAFTQKGQ
jgi:HEAT repeat protein